jgi:hypothetical protein
MRHDHHVGVERLPERIHSEPAGRAKITKAFTKKGEEIKAVIIAHQKCGQVV